MPFFPIRSSSLRTRETGSCGRSGASSREGEEGADTGYRRGSNSPVPWHQWPVQHCYALCRKEAFREGASCPSPREVFLSRSADDEEKRKIFAIVKSYPFPVR